MNLQTFLDRRLAGLVRFAVVLVQERERAELLVEQAVLRVADDYPDGDDPDVLYAASRVWVARGFLAQGMVPGNPAAEHVDRTRSVPTPDADLAQRVDAVSMLGRAVLVLRYRELMPAAIVAETVGSTPDGILLYLDHLLDGLGVRHRRRSADAAPAAFREADLENLLDRHGADVRSDVSAVRRTLSIALGFVEADIPVPAMRPTEAHDAEPQADALEPDEYEEDEPDRSDSSEPHVADGERSTTESRIDGITAPVGDLDVDDLPEVAAAETIAQQSPPDVVEPDANHATRVSAALALVAQLRAGRAVEDLLQSEPAEAERLEAEPAAARRGSQVTGVPAEMSAGDRLDLTTAHGAVRTPSSPGPAPSHDPDLAGSGSTSDVSGEPTETQPEPDETLDDDAVLTQVGTATTALTSGTAPDDPPAQESAEAPPDHPWLDLAATAPGLAMRHHATSASDADADADADDHSDRSGTTAPPTHEASSVPLIDNEVEPAISTDRTADEADTASTPERLDEDGVTPHDITRSAAAVAGSVEWLDLTANPSGSEATVNISEWMRSAARRIDAERIEAERSELNDEASGRAEFDRVETARLDAVRLIEHVVLIDQGELDQEEAEQVEAERVEAERVEAERPRLSSHRALLDPDETNLRDERARERRAAERRQRTRRRGRRSTHATEHIPSGENVAASVAAEPVLTPIEWLDLSAHLDRFASAETHVEPDVISSDEITDRLSEHLGIRGRSASATETAAAHAVEDTPEGRSSDSDGRSAPGGVQQNDLLDLTPTTSVERTVRDDVGQDDSGQDRLFAGDLAPDDDPDAADHPTDGPTDTRPEPVDSVDLSRRTPAALPPPASETRPRRRRGRAPRHARGRAATASETTDEPRTDLGDRAGDEASSAVVGTDPAGQIIDPVSSGEDVAAEPTSTSDSEPRAVTADDSLPSAGGTTDEAPTAGDGVTDGSDDHPDDDHPDDDHPDDRPREDRTDATQDTAGPRRTLDEVTIVPTGNGGPRETRRQRRIRSQGGRRLRRNLLLLAVIAAAILTAVAVAVASHRDSPRSGRGDGIFAAPTTPDAVPASTTPATPSRRTTAPTSRTASPSNPATASPSRSAAGGFRAAERALPGTRTLQSRLGTGSATVSARFPKVRTGRELAIAASCSGAGPVRIGSVVMQACTGPVIGGIPASRGRTLKVTAPPGTRWEFSIVDQPATGANGSLYRLPSAALSPVASRLLGHRAGAGRARLGLRTVRGARTSNVRVALTCRGSGVRLSSSDGRANGSFTHTCFVGWVYLFDLQRVTLPATLTVTGKGATTWHVVVSRI